MYRFLFASTLAVTGVFGFAKTADAQYSYGYQTYVPGGVVNNRTVITPFGAQSVNRYYSPYTGFSARQTYYADAWGNEAARLNTYNPYINFGYRTGYSYTPYGFNGPAYNPYGYYYWR